MQLEHFFLHSLPAINYNYGFAFTSVCHPEMDFIWLASEAVANVLVKKGICTAEYPGTT